MMRGLRVKRIAAFLCAVLLLCSLLSGCGARAPQQTGETKVVVDCLGREVTIPRDPQRVACLYASTAHMMALVGVEDRIVGAPDGVRRDVLMQQKFPGIVDIAVPYQEGSINIEELARIQADLALVRRSTAENPAEVEKLEKMGIPYVAVDYANIDELRTAIDVVGQVFDQTQKTDEFLAFFDETLQLVDARIGDLPAEQRIRVYHAVNEASRTDVAGDLCSEITQRAGLINVSVEGGLASGGEKSYTTLEQIYTWSPICIICNDPNTTEYILTDAKWSGLAAVQNRRVYTLPVGVTRWCHPGSMEAHMAVLFLARQFHPEQFADIHMMQYTKTYYERFFDLELTDEQVMQVLSGNGMRLEKENAKREE